MPDPAPVTVHPIASSRAGVFLSHEELRRFAEAVHRATLDAVLEPLDRLMAELTAVQERNDAALRDLMAALPRTGPR